MPLTRVKICGITRPEDALAAAEFGADAIGLNFFAGPRRITIDRARQILSILPPMVTPVALTSGPAPRFPDALSFREIRRGTAGQGIATIDTLQFFGTDVALADAPDLADIWTVCPVDDQNIGGTIYKHLNALNFSPRTLVIDAAVPGKAGGTGRTVNWTAVRSELQWLCEHEAFMYLVLAGGLNPDNVAEAIRIVRPYGVDVSSGVELPGNPGIKDRAKLRDFIQAAQGA